MKSLPLFDVNVIVLDVKADILSSVYSSVVSSVISNNSPSIADDATSEGNVNSDSAGIFFKLTQVSNVKSPFNVSALFMLNASPSPSKYNELAPCIF